MSLIYLEGHVSTAVYEQICIDNGLVPSDKKCIFLFPGNSSHHGEGTTLFSIKSGGGLAAASGEIGTAGYPTLSLPTTTMEQWDKNLKQQEIVQGAIEDLYRAVGAGYHLILPVRAHQNKKYFDKGLPPNHLVEPNFWGGIQKAPNKKLANYYSQQLHDLYQFLLLPTKAQEEVAREDSAYRFYQAYLEGRKMNANNPRLNTESVSHEKLEKKAEQIPSSVFHTKPEKQAVQIPSSYESFNKEDQDSLQNARDLLNDYTKNNSMLLRFFSGHWNRHHVAEVNALVERIDEGDIDSVAELLRELRKIHLENSNGSLARRIQTIEENNPFSDQPHSIFTLKS